MKFIQFIQIIQPNSKFFLQESCPENLTLIFEYYFVVKNEVLKHIKDVVTPELVLFHDTTLSHESRLFEFQHKKYLLVSLPQISIISQFMEIFFFGFVDPKSKVSFFHQNLIDINAEYLQFTSHADMVDEETNDVVGNIILKNRFEFSEKDSDYYVEKINSNDFVKTFSALNGFKNIFEFYVVFLLTHEYTHFFIKKHEGLDLSEFVYSAYMRNCVFGDELIKIINSHKFNFSAPTNELISNELKEEIDCDYWAFYTAVKIVSTFKNYNDLFLILVPPIFYGALLLSKKRKTEKLIQEFFIRKVFLINSVYDVLKLDSERTDISDRERLFTKKMKDFSSVINIYCTAILGVNLPLVSEYEFRRLEPLYKLRLYEYDNLEIIKSIKNEITSILNQLNSKI